MSSGGIRPRRYAPVDCPTPGARSNGYSVRHAPPTTGAASKTRTRNPARASINAATRPLCPAPTINTSTDAMASIDEEAEAAFDAPGMVRRAGRHLEVPHPSTAHFEAQPLEETISEPGERANRAGALHVGHQRDAEVPPGERARERSFLMLPRSAIWRRRRSRDRRAASSCRATGSRRRDAGARPLRRSRPATGSAAIFAARRTWRSCRQRPRRR